MKISPIMSRNLFGVKNAYLEFKNLENPIKKTIGCDVFVPSKNTSKKELSFRGYPYRLNQPMTSSISADEAIELYEKLALGNYLDIDGNAKKPQQRAIRRENLAFLDKIKTKKAKEKFINNYKDLTCFPNMYLVAENIKREFTYACREAETVNKENFPQFAHNYDILCAGYDGISSVAKRTALPGSDLDKAYVILRGCDSDYGNEIIVNNFKAKLWNNTDQRILSYNHDADSFPKVYTLKQIRAIQNSINKTAKEMNLDQREPLPYKGFIDMLLGERKYKTKRGEYKLLTNNFNSDYTKANKFLIDIAEKYSPCGDWDKPINPDNLTREDIYRASFILEAMHKGEILIGSSVLYGTDTSAIELLNLSQIDAIKRTNPQKDKYLLRRNLREDFEKWDTNKQFDFIKETIKASCSDETEFPEYFHSDTSDKFNLLLKRLNLGE